MRFLLNHLHALELVSKELNHFGVIAGLFWQFGGHSSRFVLFEIITIFFLLHKIQTPCINMQNGCQVI
jgi:hypothetical protein